MVAGEFQQRARRFSMAMPLVFRQSAESEWQDAQTLNLSRTGILFRTEGAAPARDRQIEFIVSLPLFSADLDSRVRCTGRVARVAAEAPAEGGKAVGVTIDSYEFLGPPSDPH
ncbi:MAG: PilZ domain-containing protein [Rhodospirillaceae bacterium]